jgi:hypothetical protein
MTDFCQVIGTWLVVSFSSAAWEVERELDISAARAEVFWI